ncbi:methyltransferase family protein [Streptococcus equinus]|uniref:methyltransferase family protein n=1 Tax=Streptococcus equinus TaxID=1335 RepID=UPI000885D6FF|nr:isoprenylcysteine carboxylmethyltransferase family protein [Streptococcus equinus]SDQ13861.1 Protein-S-isoprenylcysteine O-methyltransferase Ste14 [Streptococcus equinus]SEN57079.1 Protein-S-isoprenylcysteine O-methyltransferase Ste14 [Streptococcus equinus]
MSKKPFLQAISKFFLGFLLVATLLFLPAGTLCYWNAWLLLAILFVPMFLAGLVMMIFSPELLKKRLNAKESEKEQQQVIKFSALMFIAAFLSAGFSFRFHWLRLSPSISYIAAAIFLLAYCMYAEVLRENAYLARTIEVQEGQKVIDTGLYGVIRHPMYTATILLFLSMGLVLGSLLSFIILLYYLPLIIKRIRNEEAVLEKDLEGYLAYEKKVQYRLFPFIW